MGFGTQFHATPIENRQFVLDELAANKLVCGVSRWDKTKIIVVSSHEVETAFDQLIIAQYYLFLKRPPKLEFFEWEMTEKYGEVLVLVAGRLHDGILDQSFLATRGNNPIFSQINRRLKKQTQAGVSLKENGNGRCLHSERFTRGAKSMFDSGVAMRQSPRVFFVLPEYVKASESRT